jgi:hypothetical protein
LQFIDAKLTNNHPNQLTFEENDANPHGFSELYSLSGANLRRQELCKTIVNGVL